MVGHANVQGFELIHRTESFFRKAFVPDKSHVKSFLTLRPAAL